MDKSKFSDKREWRKFGIGLAIITAAIGTVQLVLNKDLYFHFYAVSASSLLLGLVLPILLKPIFILFSYIGEVMGWIMTRLILSILFYAVVTPIGLIAKIFGNSFLELRISPPQESYWTDKNADESTKKYENQF